MKLIAQIAAAIILASLIQLAFTGITVSTLLAFASKYISNLYTKHDVPTGNQYLQQPHAEEPATPAGYIRKQYGDKVIEMRLLKQGNDILEVSHDANDYRILRESKEEIKH